MPSPRPFRLWLLASLASIPYLLPGCARQADAPASQVAASVGVVVLQKRQVSLPIELPGRTVASLISEVRPQVSGLIEARRFAEGSNVQKGEVLYQIDASLYQAAHDQAKADLANARAAAATARLHAEREEKLLLTHVVSTQDVDDAKAAALQASAAVASKSAALETARINLAHTEIRAPIAGHIGESSVTPGALVTAGQAAALATIRALDPIYVDLTQSAAELMKLRGLLGPERRSLAGTRVRLKLADGSEYEQAGTLKFEEVSVDPATGSVTMRAEFPNPRGVLLPGMYVPAVLEVPLAAAILAPQQGITRNPRGEGIAMVLDTHDRVERRTVVADRTLGDKWLIGAGLAVGERLIVEGLNRVQVGETVHPLILDAANDRENR